METIKVSDGICRQVISKHRIQQHVVAKPAKKSVLKRIRSCLISCEMLYFGIMQYRVNNSCRKRSLWGYCDPSCYFDITHVKVDRELHVCW